MNDLKPCPFCGTKESDSPDEEIVGKMIAGVESIPGDGEEITDSYVRCNGCDCTGPFEITEALAIKRWNTRKGKT